MALGAGTDQGHDNRDCKFRALAILEVCKTVSMSPAGKVQAWPLVVGGSRAVVYPIPRVELLEERLAVSGSARGDTTRKIAMSNGG